MNHSISRKGPSSHGSSLNFKSYAEKQQSYVERYKDAFKEESATLEFNQLFKSNQYLRECLKDLNSLMSKKIDKQKEKIFTHYKKEEHSPKKTSSQLIEEQLTLLERDYKNNNFIFSQQERELKQLDERLQGRSSNIHFELVGEIEQLNDEIRQMRNQCNTQKQYNFMEGKYLDINSQIPRNVVVQQNTALDALKLQRENERIKDLTKKKEELMKEFAKKIQNVDKKFNIANSKQFEEVNESLAKKIAEEKRKTESLELKIDIIIKSYEREQLKHKQIQKDVSLIEKHTDDKVNALELQIRQLNADMQQIQELGQEVDQNQKQERISQSDFKLTQQEEGNEQSKYRGITPLKPIKSDNKLDQSKSMNPMMKKKVIGKISLNKSNLELLQISSKDLKPKVDVHSVSIQQTPTDQKQQQEQQPYFSASNKLKQQQSQEKDSINHNNDDSQFEGNNPKNEQQNLDDSAVFNPKHNQNKTNKRSSQQNFQMERNNKENKQKYEQDDGDDYDNIDNIQAEIKNLQEEEEEEQAVKAGNDHKEQMKQKPKVNSGKNLSQDSHTGMEQQGNNHINIPNKPIESIYDLEESNNHESKSNQQKQRLISKLNSNEQIQNQSKVSQHNIKNSNDNLQNDSKNELKSQIFYNEPTGIQALNQSIKVDQLNNIKRSSNPSILPVIKNNNNNNNNNNVPLKSDAGFNKQNYQNMNKDNSIDSNSNNNNINNQLNKKHENNNTQQEGSKKQIQNQVNTKQGSSQQQNEKKKENEGKDVWEELSDL